MHTYVIKSPKREDRQKPQVHTFTPTQQKKRQRNAQPSVGLVIFVKRAHRVRSSSITANECCTITTVKKRVLGNVDVHGAQQQQSSTQPTTTQPVRAPPWGGKDGRCHKRWNPAAKATIARQDTPNKSKEKKTRWLLCAPSTFCPPPPSVRPLLLPRSVVCAEPRHRSISL